MALISLIRGNERRAAEYVFESSILSTPAMVG